MTLHRVLLLSLTIVVMVAAHPASADAGTFDVVACDQSVAGGANNSFAPYADPGMTAYTDCSPFGKGLVARNVYDNGTTPSGNRAAMIFDAPPGATLQRITFDGAIERHTCTYSAILAAGGRDFGGSAIWGYGPGTQCDYPYAEVRTVAVAAGEENKCAALAVREVGDVLEELVGVDRRFEGVAAVELFPVRNLLEVRVVLLDPHEAPGLSDGDGP